MTDQFIPRYYEIQQALRARIAALEPGDALPSDAMLCEEFGVSRMTARNAMQRLAQEGLVRRVPGRGTFVARTPAHRQVSTLLSFSDEMRRRGRTPSSVVLQRKVRAATAVEASRLSLQHGERVVALRRLRRADGEPVALELALFSAADLAGVLLEEDLEQGSLLGILAAAGRVPTAGRARLSAQSAATDDARHLKLKRGAALLIELRLIFDQNGDPLELTESRYAATRYALEVEFDVELPDARRKKTATKSR